MAPAASTADEPSGMGQARTSSGSGGQERDQPEQPVRQLDDPAQAGLLEAELLHEHRGLVGLELAELHLDLGRQRVDHGVLVVVAGGDRRDQLGLAGDVALAHVEQHQDGLLGQEPEAPDGLGLVGIEAQVADGRARLEPGVDAPDDDLLALGGLALGLRAVLAAALEPLQAALGHGQVGQQELEVELLEIAGGIHAARRVRQGRVVEGAHDVQQRIRVAQPRQVVGRQLLGPDPALDEDAGGAGRSTYVTSAWTTFLGLKISARRSRRASGTLTTPTLRVTPP